LLLAVAAWRLAIAADTDTSSIDIDPRGGVAQREHGSLLVLQALCLAGAGVALWAGLGSRRRSALLAFVVLLGLAVLIQTKDGLTDFGWYES
jgi:hypothetical protein